MLSGLVIVDCMRCLCPLLSLWPFVAAKAGLRVEYVFGFSSLRRGEDVSLISMLDDEDRILSRTQSYANIE